MDDSNDNSSSNFTCLAYNTTEYIAIAAVNSFLSAVSFLACLMVIGFIFLFKKHMFFTQRLILYLTIAAALNMLAMAIEATVYFPKTDAFEGYCMWTGFFQQVSGWAQIMGVACMTIDLFQRVVLHIDTSRLRFEIIYVSVIITVPLLFNWIPFIDKTYGLSGPWCWIRDYNGVPGNCTKNEFGVVLALALWYGPVYPILLFLSVLYAIVVITIWRQKYLYQGNFDPHNQTKYNMRFKEVRSLLFYPLLIFFIEIFPLINRLYTLFSSDKDTTAFWWLHAIAAPFEGGLIAIIYTFDTETLRRLRFSVFRVYVIECFTCRKEVEEYHFEYGDVSDSLLIDDKSSSKEHSRKKYGASE